MPSPSRRRLWAALAGAALLAIGLIVAPVPASVVAQVPCPTQAPSPDPSVPSPCPTTTTSSSTTTTTAKEDDPNYNPWGPPPTTTTTTTAPPAGGGGGGSGGGTGGGAPSGGGTGGETGGGSGGSAPSGGGSTGGGTTTGGPVASPPPPAAGFGGFPLPPAAPPIQGFGDLQSIDKLFSSYQPVPGARSTKEIVELLAGAGIQGERLGQILAPFPVAGLASYSDDWGAPRLVPTFHSHQGVDVFAARGTPVVAAGEATVSDVQTGTAIGGNTVYLTFPDGTYLYYAHLDSHAPGLAKGQSVQPGQVIGTVGTSGNAEGTAPHLHFEIHPQGGGPVPPVAYLDGWLRDALERARELTGQQGAPDLSQLGLPDTLTAPTLPLVRNAADRRAADPPENPTGVLVLLGCVIAFFVWRRYKATRRVDELVTTSPLLLMSMRGKPSRLIPRTDAHQEVAAEEAAATR